MKLLIIGGTRFLGRHFAQQALAAGHALTLLHRGRSGPGLFPEAEHLVADRNADLSVLSGRSWDAVIDTSAYVPRHVRSLAAALGSRVGQYQLVSTISVYAELGQPGMDEEAPLATLSDPTTEVIDGNTYGGLKVLCEQAAAAGFGHRCLVARPGLIVGPHDPSGRFTWWVQRLARAAPGEAVLAPGDPAAPMQCIDARDAAAWLLRQAEAGSRGICNLTGPDEPASLGDLLDTARRLLAPQARLEWVDEAFLLAHGVGPWMELPLWLPAADSALSAVSIARAQALGLRCRPLAQTLADTAAWVAGGGAPAVAAVGLAPGREAELLAAWRARTPH